MHAHLRIYMEVCKNVDIKCEYGRVWSITSIQIDVNMSVRVSAEDGMRECIEFRI